MSTSSMRMSRHTGTFNITLLSAQLQERFHSLFKVVEKRTIFSWSEAPIGAAQVVVTDNKHATLPATTLPCLAFVGNKSDAESLKPGFNHTFQVESAFTVSQLLDVLDRAAVRLLDSRHTTAATAPVASVELYKLKRWVILPQHLAGSNYTAAMALLTRGQMSLNTICTHAGLQQDDARALVDELNSQGALLTINDVASAATPAADAVAAPSPDGKAQNGLFGKLARWLSSNRAFATK